jgi:hypothetical protein
MTTPELVPCQFCDDARLPVASGYLRGTAAEMQTQADVWSWSVRHHCGAQGPECDTENEAIAAWNTRAPLSPAVLAELPEVRALADDLASCIAMIQHAIGQGKDTFIEPDTKRKLSDARTRLETFRAAAIREGRNG